MHIFYKNRYLVDFLAAVMFFTRIPINWSSFSEEAPDLTRAAWSFPIIGLIVGFFCGLIGDICVFFGIPTLLSCLIAIALSVLVTGAFHEDGLADMADGFGAGGSPERINEIMHDSRLGTYGVVTLTLALLIRTALVVGLANLGYSILFILSTGFASGKLAIIFMRNFFGSSEFAKTGSIVGFISGKNFLLATFSWLVPVTFVFPLFGILLGTVFVAGLIYFIGSKSNHFIGGITGDILGATALLGELLFLFGVILIASGVP